MMDEGAQAHTGTDRVELTDAEREAIEHAWIISPQDGPAGDDDPMYRAVESIVAARVQALTAERDDLRRDNETWQSTCQTIAHDKNVALAERDAARVEAEERHRVQARCTDEVRALRAELAAANADRDWEEAQKNALRKAADKHIAALQETLDRVTALADEWETRGWDVEGISPAGFVSDLRAALTPEGKP